MKKLQLIIPVVILLSLLTWRIAEKRSEMSMEMSQKGGGMRMPVVDTAPVQLRDIFHIFECTGSVESPLDVKLSPRVSGRIEYLVAREGDYVKKGQVLVKIDPSDVEAQVRQAKASVAEAQYRLAQAELTQNPTNVAVNTQIQQQKAGVASAKADYSQVSENYQSQLAAAEASVTDTQSKIDVAQAAVSNAKAAIGSAQANLDNARAKYNRIFDLYKQGFVAAQDVDDAKATVSVQEASLEVAKGQLRSANAQLSSATAQKTSAQQQVDIVRRKGKADIEASKAKLTQARASAEYAVANTAQKSAYSQSIAALKASVDAARASLASAEARLSDTILKAPMDGYVTARFADPGSLASAGQPVVTVQFMKQVWVSISVPEDICAKMKMGDPVSIRLDAYPEKLFMANVAQINPSADPQSRQFTVKVSLDNRQGLLKPGMFAHVKVDADKAMNTLSVPREALQKDKDGACVFTVDGKGNVKRCAVIAGISDDSFVSIRSGVNPGDKVVTMCAMPLRDGMTVRTGGGKRRGSR